MMAGMSEIEMSVSEFKAKAMEILNNIESSGEEYLLTKRGEPIARVVPFVAKERNARGSYKGFVEITGDLVGSTSQDLWEVLDEDPT